MSNLDPSANNDKVLKKDDGELERLGRLLNDLATDHKAGFFAQARAEQAEQGPTRGSYNRTIRRAKDLARTALGECSVLIKLGRELDDLAANHEAVYIDLAIAQLADQELTGNSYGRVLEVARELACADLGVWAKAVEA